jgi:hypothetical protein
VYTELEITNLEKKKKKKKMMTNPLMHREGVSNQCGWFRVFDACNTRQFCRETLRVFEKSQE